METIALVRLASTLAKHRGCAVSTISTYAANDGKFFGRLSSGAGCTVLRAGRILAWFNENWPADLEWPRDIIRPSSQKTKGRAA